MDGLMDPWLIAKDSLILSCIGRLGKHMLRKGFGMKATQFSFQQKEQTRLGRDRNSWKMAKYNKSSFIFYLI